MFLVISIFSGASNVILDKTTLTEVNTDRTVRGVYLQLSEGVVTLLLAWSLLCAQRDQLVNAVSHSSETKKTNHTLVQDIMSSSH